MNIICLYTVKYVKVVIDYCLQLDCTFHSNTVSFGSTRSHFLWKLSTEFPFPLAKWPTSCPYPPPPWYWHSSDCPSKSRPSSAFSSAGRPATVPSFSQKSEVFRQPHWTSEVVQTVCQICSSETRFGVFLQI